MSEIKQVIYTEEEHRAMQEDINTWRSLSGPINDYKNFYPYKHEALRKIMKERLSQVSQNKVVMFGERKLKKPNITGGLA